jgi:DNA polymerase-1
MTMGEAPKTIYLVDGSGYIHRAYHAVRHLSTSQGLPTNATFGFTNMVLKLLSEKNPEYVAMALDAKGPTFRHTLYAAYKANRPSMPEDLVVQLPYIKQVVEGMNIPVLELAGYEADDIIGTVVRLAEDAGFKVVMVTGDKDFRQLVSRHSTMWDPMRDRTIAYGDFKKEVGLEPLQWVDVMALAGDTSDNVPGVPGVGEKTAVELIQRFGTLDGVFENIDQLKNKRKLWENLTTYREQALLSRRLVSIDTEVPLRVDLPSFRMEPPDRAKLVDLFKTLEFRKLQERFSITQDLSGKDYHAITDEKALESLIDALKRSPVFAVDLETTAKDPMLASIVGISFSCVPDQAVYIPLGHTRTEGERQLDMESTLSKLRPFLEDPGLAKVGQNIKYDWIVLKRAGVDLKGVVFDTMVASYLLDPGRRVHSLENIAATYLNHRMITYEEVTRDKKGQKGFEEVLIKDAVPYACEDADVTLSAYQVLKKKLEGQGLDDLFHDVEMPLISALVDMEIAGIAVDEGRLKTISKDFEGKLAQIEENIYTIAGERFNIQSPQQMGHILFDKLGLSLQKKTKKKTGYSTDVEVLTALSAEHELPALVLAYRSLAKLKSTYADALVGLIHPETHRIHTSYNQTVTATGRLSSSNPNLQNIPVRTEEGRSIRAAFVAREGCLLLSADYSQIELRVLAHYSKDPILVEAFETDQDVHTRTAAEVFQLFPSMITPDMRRQAKVINFGIIYGMGPFRLAKELGISQKMARTYIDHYFTRYEGVKRFIDETIKGARQSGEVRTLLGRVRRLPDILSTNRTVREFSERTAVNTPLQGTAADLIKLSMIRIHEALVRQELKAKMLLQVHDELVFEVPREERDRVTDLVRSIMEGVYDLGVPLKVNISAGDNWAEAH